MVGRCRTRVVTTGVTFTSARAGRQARHASDRGGGSRTIGWLSGGRTALGRMAGEVAKFGLVGGAAYLIGVYAYNVLRTGVWPLPHPPLAGQPVVAKVISNLFAMAVAWLGNRYWTFRRRRGPDLRRELGLFVATNTGGLLIALGCLSASHYLLGFTSAWADNISGNLVGDLVLGTLFRFWALRTFVFAEPGRGRTPGHAFG